MVDSAAVRALAGEVEELAGAVAAQAAGLRVLAAADWSGPASRVCWWAVEEAVRRALAVERSLHDGGAVLRRHAAAVDHAQSAQSAQWPFAQGAPVGWWR